MRRCRAGLLGRRAFPDRWSTDASVGARVGHRRLLAPAAGALARRLDGEICGSLDGTPARRPARAGNSLLDRGMPGAKRRHPDYAAPTLILETRVGALAAQRRMRSAV